MSLSPKLLAFESNVGYSSTSKFLTRGIGLFMPLISNDGPAAPESILSRTRLIA